MTKIINFLCLSLLLLGATALGMDPVYACPGIQTRQATPGAVVDPIDQGKQLIDAARRGNLEEVKELIAHGASVEAKDDYGATPLSFAVLNNHEEMCKLLIANKAIVDEKNNEEATPLVVAARNGRENICRLLIANKATVEAKDIYGWTSLAYAAQYHYENVWKFLIDTQLEQARKDNPALIVLLGIAKNRRSEYSRYVPYDVARMIAHQVFEDAVYQAKQRVIEQFNQFSDQAKANWLVYINQKMNPSNK